MKVDWLDATGYSKNRGFGNGGVGERNKLVKISVVLPSYLEAENLKKILPSINEELRVQKIDYEILVIDTMEPMDNTKEVCEDNNATYVVRQGGNLYGDAIRTGFSVAQGQYVVVMDADGSHNPKDIVRFCEEMEKENWDLVIGSRYCKGGKTDNNFILRFMSWTLNVTYRIFFGLKVKDISDSFRMYRSEQVKLLNLECMNFDIVEEILITLNYTHNTFRIKEIPISFGKRATGESKRDLVKFIKSYLKTIRRLLIIKKKYK